MLKYWSLVTAGVLFVIIGLGLIALGWAIILPHVYEFFFCLLCFVVGIFLLKGAYELTKDEEGTA